MLDTNDLTVVNREETLLFYMVGTCFVVTIDLEDNKGVKSRLAYHMKGEYVDKEVALETLLKRLEEQSRVTSLLVMYNSIGYGKIETEEYRKFINNYPHEFVDMDKIDPWGSHDVIVRGDSALIYYNHGVLDAEVDEEIVKRVYGGEVKVC